MEKEKRIHPVSRTSADDTLTTAAQKSSFTSASNVIKFKNTGGDTLTIKAQGYGVKRYTNY